MKSFLKVVAVSLSDNPTFRNPKRDVIQLVAGLGVENDVHSGITVKHRSRALKTQPNLRQVHLIHAEFLDEHRTAGFVVLPGQMGENITTHGIDLLGLPTGTRLNFGQSAVVSSSWVSVTNTSFG